MKSYNGFTPKQRMDAFNWLKKEMEAGKRDRLPLSCDACGQKDGSLMWHSEDYSFPYGEHIGHYGLCYICHMMIHCRFNNATKWQEYKAKIKEGFKYQCYNFNNWMSFKKDFLGDGFIYRDCVYSAKADFNILEEIEFPQKKAFKMEEVGNTTSGEGYVS